MKPSKPLSFEPLSEWGDHMTRESFIATVACGGFIDYDGDGDLATEADPHYVWPDWATHVMWYNR